MQYGQKYHNSVRTGEQKVGPTYSLDRGRIQGPSYVSIDQTPRARQRNKIMYTFNPTNKSAQQATRVQYAWVIEKRKSELMNVDTR